MATKIRVSIILVGTLMVFLLAGCALPGFGSVRTAQPTETPLPAATVSATSTATPAPTRTPRSTSVPASTATDVPALSVTMTRTPRPTATRWVVERLTATAQAAVAQPAKPTPQPAVVSAGGSSGGLSGKLLLMRASGGEIYRVDAGGGSLSQLAYGLDPSWSPDGSQIAFTRWDGPDAGLWVADADGSNARKLYGHNMLKETAWTADGESVIFSMQNGGKEERQVCFPPFGCFTIGADPYWRLALVNVADGAFRDLSSDLHSHSPSLSPDGISVVYAGDRGLQTTALSERNEGLIREESQLSSPAVSPDGTHIVYMLYLHDHWDLFMTTLDGHTSVRLTRTSVMEPKMANYVAPAWSPDGKHIAFMSDRDGAWQLYVMNADGSGQRLFLADALAGIDFVYDFANERMIDWDF
jgi:Tol biopolymer transport system component